MEEITGKDVKYATAPLDGNKVNNTVFQYLAKNDIVQLGYKFNPFDVPNKSPSEATADYLKNKNPKYDTFIIALYEMNIQDEDELNDIITEMQKNFKIVPMTQCLKNFKPGDTNVATMAKESSFSKTSLLNPALNLLFHLM